MAYDSYVFVLCLIVYVLLTVISVIVVATITKMSIRLIRHGAEDEKIKKEYAKRKKKRKRGIFERLVSLLFCVIFFGAFSFALYVNLQGDKYFSDIPTLKVVNSASMSKKHEKNKYLTENNLNDQFQTFDLICLYELPAEADLKLYDIVLYEVDDILIIHRIVEIEEPNQEHPNERYFRLQGDAIERADRFPVKYSQMRAIYRGENVPHLGSVVSFLQSPAGWLCIILIMVAMIASPVFDKKISRAMYERYEELLAKQKKAKATAIKKKEEQKGIQWSAPVCLYPVYYHENPPALGQVVPPNTEERKK